MKGGVGLLGSIAAPRDMTLVRRGTSQARRRFCTAQEATMFVCRETSRLLRPRKISVSGSHPGELPVPMMHVSR